MPPLRIFISYGRDQYAPLAARLANDLPRNFNCEVWYDQSLQTSQRWEEIIESRLDWVAQDPPTGRFIYLLTPHSTRNGGWCRRELTYILNKQVLVFPVLVADCQVPLSICDVQHLDFRSIFPVEQHEVEYRKQLQRLVNDLKGGQSPSPEPTPKPTTPGIKKIPQRTQPPRHPPTGETRVREVDGMLEVYVPVGEFLMGSDDGRSDEKPRHRVMLDAYWIDQTPVTNAMFARFLDERGNQNEVNTDWYYPASGKIKQEGKLWRVESAFEQHPVVSVAWYGARAYAQWVGAKLPSEAQWEKAARGTDGREYPWGDNEPDPTLANYNLNVGSTTPVGSYPAGASPYGALDMAGNVWEWCADWYGEAYYAKSPPENPTGPSSGDWRVVRGGSWYDGDRYLRAAYRNWYNPYDWFVNQGFRCCR